MELAHQFGYEVGEGVIVSSVTKGSPADMKGIEVGMIILSVNQRYVDSAKAFNRALEKTVNDKVLLLVGLLSKSCWLNNNGKRDMIIIMLMNV